MRWSAFFRGKNYLGDKKVKATKSEAEKIFENIIFLADVFGDQAATDIPSLPVLEMARCFELEPPYLIVHASARQQKDWPLWN